MNREELIRERLAEAFYHAFNAQTDFLYDDADRGDEKGKWSSIPWAETTEENRDFFREKAEKELSTVALFPIPRLKG